MTLLDLEAFRRASLATEPYEYALVPHFVRPTAIPGVLADFPVIEQGGSFPLNGLQYGPVFAELCEELRGEAVRDAFAEKFQMDLSGRPTTLTVRGRCRAKDGQVHTDSRTKLITVLVYLNDCWEAAGGRLRLLRTNNLADVITEALPQEGSLVCFRNRENAWHGHLPYEGVRRVLQLNWVTDESAVRASERRHGWSALLKRYNPFRRSA